MIKSARILGERRGVAVYLVGGPVRDLMLGRASADLDLTVAGDGVAYARALAAHLGAQVTIHAQFGTATLILRDGLRLDVATARREKYLHPAALPQVFPGTIHDDLFRRDFTMNAMAVRVVPRPGELLDPFGGRKDLIRGFLRVLHEESYRDDPTRIFRGARYAARYRLRFSPRDRRLIRDVLGEDVLQRLSRERLFRELRLVLDEPTPEAALKILQNRGVLKTLDPALTVDDTAVAQMRRVRHAWQRFNRVETSSRPRRWRIYLLVLLLCVPPTVRRRVAERLGVKGPPLDALMAELRDFAFLQEQLQKQSLRASRLRHLLDRASVDLCILLWASKAKRVRDRVGRYLTHLAAVKPALAGRDLKKL
ncbi:MAG: CCA tRNA nucleotidyltransferase, partial [Candidatus Methylomirabilales bacterium]